MHVCLQAGEWSEAEDIHRPRYKKEGVWSFFAASGASFPRPPKPLSSNFIRRENHGYLWGKNQLNTSNEIQVTK